MLMKTQPTRREREAAEEESDVPNPAEQLRLLNEVDAERRLDEEEFYARERAEEAEMDRLHGHQPTSRFWTGGWNKRGAR